MQTKNLIQMSINIYFLIFLLFFAKSAAAGPLCWETLTVSCLKVSYTMESKKEKLSAWVYYETFLDLQRESVKGINLNVHRKLNANIVWIFEEILALKRTEK